MAGYTLDQESIARLAQLLRTYEQGGLDPSQPAGPDGGMSPAVQVVKVTGVKNAAGWQPGTIQIWNNASKSFTTGIVCHIRTADSSTLPTNTMALGRLSSTEDNVPVFVVVMDPATESMWGLVTSGTQNIGGNKTFYGQITVRHPTAAPAGVILQAQGGTVSNAGDTIKLISQSVSNDMLSVKLYSYSGSNFSELYLYAPPVSGTIRSIGMIADSTYGSSKFMCAGASGQTGTLKSNATVTGGIITNLGTTSVQSSSWMGF